MMWLQISRIEWLKSRDNNTIFFHTSTVVRRRRNKIHMLMDNEGRWVEGKEELKQMAVEFYSNLFKSNSSRRSAFINGEFCQLRTSTTRGLGGCGKYGEEEERSQLDGVLESHRTGRISARLLQENLGYCRIMCASICSRNVEKEGHPRGSGSNFTCSCF